MVVVVAAVIRVVMVVVITVVVVMVIVVVVVVVILVQVVVVIVVAVVVVIIIVVVVVVAVRTTGNQRRGRGELRENATVCTVPIKVGRERMIAEQRAHTGETSWMFNLLDIIFIFTGDRSGRKRHTLQVVS